jgi:hypothetical protein
MRVYLPGNKSDLDLLANDQNLTGRSGFALLPEWTGLQPDDDPEILEEELVYLAAAQSLLDGQRIVLVADLAAEVISGPEGTVQVGNFGKKQILALFGDDSTNKSAILAGADPNSLDLTWFGPTEILNFKDFLGI